MSLDGLYQLRTSKHNHFAFAIHSERILEGAKVAEYEERPGKIYLVPAFEKGYFTHDAELEMSLQQICEYYRLNPIESFRKSAMANHYEIMGKLLTLYQASFPEDSLISNTNVIYQNSNLRHYPIERPGKMYLHYNNSTISADKFENALKRICDYENIRYVDSFRKAGMKDHYEIMGELLNYYKAFLHSSPTIKEKLEEAPSSLNRMSCP
ncbi:hypothetical protein [Candidatus Berkiella aquae]|uniref:Uncharacterized protein n=1 Tax=Candidatus Berkiella aquae TaxID=295108 RepID=A0A0Q9YM94_9GAMM|nr:hypothetical protein [Candidatus Berkiella aquae]MCS5710424.1 hypothetical protein [Candidatus Berkiella aquae]